MSDWTFNQFNHINGDATTICTCGEKAIVLKKKDTPRIALCSKCGVLSVHTDKVKITKQMKVHNRQLCREVSRHSVRK